jgi:hypothetical protein
MTLPHGEVAGAGTGGRLDDDVPVRAPSRSHMVILVVAALLLGACSDDDGDGTEAADAPSTTQTAAPAVTPFAGYESHEAVQYTGTDNWICHPELADDQCRDLDTTVVRPDGTQEVEALEPATDPSFDCFYVYPTTSSDPGPNSDLAVDASEIDTVRAQVARYASVCRVFAPAYRQITLSALGGGATPEARETAYGDVLDAWKTYVGEANDGRGVVLIGHSQGASLLRRLLAEEVDPQEGLRSLLVSAVLLGTSVPEPQAGGAGGTLANIPACDAEVGSGCLVSYSSYPAAAPPVEGALFGRVREEGQRALCVDPVALAGTDGLADAVLPVKASLLGGTGAFEGVTTPFVSLPGALRTSCATNGAYTYLAVEQADPADPRPVGTMLEQRLGPTWGLHLYDANLAQDDLIALVARQADAHAG